MATLLIQHQVKDFDSWKQVFDSVYDLRASNGETSYHIYQDANDPNTVTGLFTWDSLENAQAYTQSSELKEAMNKAGVVGTPSIYFLNEV